MRSIRIHCTGRFLSLFLLLFLFVPVKKQYAQGQTEGIYKGKLALPQGSAAGATYFQNSVIISIDKAGNVSGKLNFRGGSADKQEEYIHFSGTFKGQLQGSSFDVAGTPLLLSLDNKPETLDHVGFRMSGQITNSGNTSQIAGKMLITNSEQDGGTQSLAYTAKLSAAEGIQLLFPLGESPKVFDKGWKFGASCIVGEGTDNEADLSENIKWSGTATFSPDKGAESSPVFEHEGTNKIILSVQDAQGNVIEKEFKVEVVLASKYAHTGCIAFGAADTHGCMACPHPVVGFITGSATDVTINGLATACKGDNGTHSACCGANTFVLNEGDPNVLIHGKEAVLIGAQTEHCGGKGVVKKSIPALGMALAANDSAFYIDPWGEPDKVNSSRYSRLDTKYIGTTYITREKGSLTLSLFPKGILTAGPNTQLKILSDEAGVMKIQVDKGSLYFNGHSTRQGEVVIELKDCGLVLKGTRFSLNVSEQGLKLDLLEGYVDLKFNKSGETIAIQPGESVTSDFSTITGKKPVDSPAVIRQWQQIAENTPGTRSIEIEETGSQAWWQKYLSTNMLIMAGVGFFLLVVLVSLIARNRRQKRRRKMVQSSVQPPVMPPLREYVSQPGLISPPPPAGPTPKFCPSCGYPLKPGSKFCGQCGFKTA